MIYQRDPTPAQWVMIICIAVILVALIIFGIWEINGILSGIPEQTFSEWVWDLEVWALIPFTAVSMVLTIVLGWFTLHIWEGYISRRRRERKDSTQD